MKMSWEYVAGFFDGEGCITFNKNNIIRIIFTQKEALVLDIIDKFLYQNDIRSKSNYIKLSGCINLCINRHLDQLVFLTKIIDHLIVKKSKAIEALKIIKNRKYQNEHYTLKEERLIKLFRERNMAYKEITEKLGRRDLTGVYYFCKKNNIKPPPIKLNYTNSI